MLKALYITCMVITLAVVVSAVSFSPPTIDQAPIDSKEQQDACGDGAYDAARIIGVSLCKAGFFVHVHRDDINVVSTFFIMLFTGILGFFTISLSGSTRRAAEAAKLGVEATIAYDRPIFSIGHIKLIGPDSNIIAPGSSLIPSTQPRISFANCGRTAAQAIACGIDWAVCERAEKLPPSPNYANIAPYPTSAVIRPEKAINLDVVCQIDLSEVTLCKLNKFTEFLFVYGFIRYKSLFGGDYEYRFCGKWVVAGVGQPVGFVWDSDTPPEYTKST